MVQYENNNGTYNIYRHDSVALFYITTKCSKRNHHQNNSICCESHTSKLLWKWMLDLCQRLFLIFVIKINSSLSVSSSFFFLRATSIFTVHHPIRRQDNTPVWSSSVEWNAHWFATAEVKTHSQRDSLSLQNSGRPEVLWHAGSTGQPGAANMRWWGWWGWW